MGGWDLIHSMKWDARYEQSMQTYWLYMDILIYRNSSTYSFLCVFWKSESWNGWMSMNISFWSLSFDDSGGSSRTEEGWGALLSAPCWLADFDYFWKTCPLVMDWCRGQTVGLDLPTYGPSRTAIISSLCIYILYIYTVRNIVYTYEDFISLHKFGTFFLVPIVERDWSPWTPDTCWRVGPPPRTACYWRQLAIVWHEFGTLATGRNVGPRTEGWVMNDFLWCSNLVQTVLIRSKFHFPTIKIKLFKFYFTWLELKYVFFFSSKELSWRWRLAESVWNMTAQAKEAKRSLGFLEYH